MNSKIRVAFIKFAGLSAGGTERWLQAMAANFPKNRFVVDYYYCDAAPYLGSDYKHADTDLDRLKYMQDHGVNLIKFYVGFKDVTVPTHDWLETDFWKKFDENQYDIVQSGKAGPSEYPFNKFKKVRIVDSVHLFGVDQNPNIVWTCFLSEWSRAKWGVMGGDLKKSSVVSAPIRQQVTQANLRGELNIPSTSLVAGYIQRPENSIASEIPLVAFSKIKNSSHYFLIMGGGDFYRDLAAKLNLKNVYFIEPSSDDYRVSAFLNTLDVFAHGRKDGETFGTVLAEAMFHGLPCLSHRTEFANAQVETMGPGGLFAENLEDYVLKLDRLFNDAELRKELAKKGKDYATNNYQLESSIAKLSSIYESIFKDEGFESSLPLNSSQVGKTSVKENFYKSVFLIEIKKIIYHKYCFKLFRLISKCLNTIKSFFKSVG